MLDFDQCCQKWRNSAKVAIFDPSLAVKILAWRIPPNAQKVAIFGFFNFYLVKSLNKTIFQKKKISRSAQNIFLFSFQHFSCEN